MANQEHLDILRQGADIWNEWRNGNSEIHPDLSQANLSFANLLWANLRDSQAERTYYNHKELGSIMPPSSLSPR